MFAKQFVFRDFHYDYVRRVFGREGCDLLAHTTAYATDNPRSHVNMGDDFVHLMLNEGDFEDAFVFIHEFGHVWHAVKHPDLSKTAPLIRCEAAAYKAEAQLAKNSPVFHDLLSHRLSNWLPEGRMIVSRVSPHVSIKVAVPGILRGLYG